MSAAAVDTNNSSGSSYSQFDCASRSASNSVRPLSMLTSGRRLPWYCKHAQNPGLTSSLY